MARQELKDFQHFFGNDFCIAYLIAEHLLKKDPDNPKLIRMNEALSRMRKLYIKTFEKVNENER